MLKAVSGDADCQSAIQQAASLRYRGGDVGRAKSAGSGFHS